MAIKSFRISQKKSESTIFFSFAKQIFKNIDTDIKNLKNGKT